VIACSRFLTDMLDFVMVAFLIFPMAKLINELKLQPQRRHWSRLRRKSCRPKFATCSKPAPTPKSLLNQPSDNDAGSGTARWVVPKVALLMLPTRHGHSSIDDWRRNNHGALRGDGGAFGLSG
jgi:hypothetical protein